MDDQGVRAWSDRSCLAKARFVEQRAEFIVHYHGDRINRILHVAPDLVHPQRVASGAMPAISTFRVNTSIDEPLQSAPIPRFNGEEVRRDDKIPVLLKKIPFRWSCVPAPVQAQSRAAPGCRRSCHD